MATGDFDLYYSDHPWADMTHNQRDWYVPDLLSAYKSRSVWRPFVPMKVDLAAQQTGTMIFTLLYDLEPNIDPISDRALWLTSMKWDTARVSINMEHHGGKVAYHKFDDLITFWKQNNRAGLRQICRGALGGAMTDHLDLLARNAYLTAPFRMYADQSASATGWGDIAAANLFNLEDISDVFLGLAYREVPFANNPTGVEGAMICVTTPGVLYDIQTQAGEEWRAVNSYSEGGRTALMKNEVGMYKNTRFIQSTRNTLFASGAQTTQTTLSVAASAGDGAAATVDTVYTVGGVSGKTAYVTLDTLNYGDFLVHDVVAIHVDRTSAYGVTNAPDHTSGDTCYRRVTAVDVDNKRLSFDKPLLRDYAANTTYVTKGLHIHASVCIGGPEGVVAGVGQPPQVHNPPQVEDIPSMHRFSWDAYMKYQLFRPEAIEAIFSAGNIRVKGGKSTGG